MTVYDTTGTEPAFAPRRGGRRRKLTPEQERELTALYRAGELKVETIGRRFGISRAWVPVIARRCAGEQEGA